MILLDTSAIFALASDSDVNHVTAQKLIDKIYQEDNELSVHNYVVVEAITLLQSRLGFKAATQFSADVEKFRHIWVTQEIHKAAKQYWLKQAKSKLSLTDCVSFVVMLKEKIDIAFAFDKHFEQAGFRIYK